jgi:hypothetical protein
MDPDHTSPPSKAAAKGSGKSRWGIRVGLGVALLLLVVAAWQGNFFRADDEHALPGYEGDAGEDLAVARAKARHLQYEASQDALHHLWDDCLKKLDEAKALDPDQDQDPLVQELRHAVAEALGDAGGEPDVAEGDGT